ncbi:MAG: AMP-binding protein [Acidimicrobiales bacterium]
MASWPDAISFARVWQHAVAARADQTFLIFESSSGHCAEWTYAEFDSAVARVAHALHDDGVGEGSAVHLALTNSPSFVAVWLACAQLGAWMVPSDPMAKAPELAGHISRTAPVVGVCSVERASVYRSAAPESLRVIEVHEDDVDLAPFGNVEYADWPLPALDDRLAVMFTSGTTGVPKGVVVTQANYAFAGMVMARAAGLQAHHRQLVVLPLFHANAQYYSFASAIWAGASVALMHTFSASQFCAQATRHRATHASLFAAPMRMILARHHGEGTKLEHCWYAMNVSDDQHATLTDLLGCRPRQLYGMTETIPAVLTDAVAHPVPSSMGFVSPHCEVDVHNGDGRSVGPGELGEVVVRGDRGVTIFDGYLDMPEVTRDSFRDGWFLTGDRARRDGEGRHYFDGRHSEVLKVAGENVSTVEVELVLAQHPKVFEAAVVGQPDAVRDEVPVAFVVARDPADPPTVDELLLWCAARLGKAKQPRSITLLPELPRTSVGKIRKFLLRGTEGGA